MCWLLIIGLGPNFILAQTTIAISAINKVPIKTRTTFRPVDLDGFIFPYITNCSSDTLDNIYNTDLGLSSILLAANYKVFLKAIAANFNSFATDPLSLITASRLVATSAFILTALSS